MSKKPRTFCSAREEGGAAPSMLSVDIRVVDHTSSLHHECKVLQHDRPIHEFKVLQRGAARTQARQIDQNSILDPEIEFRAAGHQTQAWLCLFAPKR